MKIPIFENTSAENIINIISSFIKDNELSACKLCLYVNYSMGKKINDFVTWLANKDDLVGGVNLEYDYGVIDIDNKKVYIVVTYKTIDNDIHIMDLDKCKYDYTPYCLNLSSERT